MTASRFADLRVTVMGLGRFGGGVGVIRFLHQRGAVVTVTDLEPADALARSVAQLADLDPARLTYHLGGHQESDFTAADLIVPNPAVDSRPGRNRYLDAARSAGVPATSEIRLLLEHLPHSRKQVVGITGSAGKSTTTAMIGHVLRRAVDSGDPRVAPRITAVHVGGNLGGSLLDRVERIGPDDVVVLELSSFMLEDMAAARFNPPDPPDPRSDASPTPGRAGPHGPGPRSDRRAVTGWSPRVAVLTNLTPNHLDRHGGFADYAAAKQSLLEHQSPDDRAVIGHPVPWDHIRPRTANLVCLQSLDNLSDRPVPRLLLPGGHNVVNARMAIEACAALGVDRRFAAAVLTEFPGLPHRLQFVCQFGPADRPVRCFNDSKSTTPEAAMLGLRAFDPGVCHVLLGGYDKGTDLADLARFAAEHAAAVYTLGATGDILAQHAQTPAPDAPQPAGLGPAFRAPVHRCHTLDRAVELAVRHAQPGQVILLSPGCASWDQFDNFEARGSAFVEHLLRTTGERS